MFLKIVKFTQTYNHIQSTLCANFQYTLQESKIFSSLLRKQNLVSSRVFMREEVADDIPKLQCFFMNANERTPSSTTHFNLTIKMSSKMCSGATQTNKVTTEVCYKKLRTT